MFIHYLRLAFILQYDHQIITCAVFIFSFNESCDRNVSLRSESVYRCAKLSVRINKRYSSATAVSRCLDMRLVKKENWNMLLWWCEHFHVVSTTTLYNNKFYTTADLSVVVKDFITQMCSIDPHILIYASDSFPTRSSQSLAEASTIDQVIKYIYRKERLYWTNEIAYNANIFMLNSNVFKNSFSTSYLHMETTVLLRLGINCGYEKSVDCMAVMGHNFRRCIIDQYEHNSYTGLKGNRIYYFKVQGSRFVLSLYSALLHNEILLYL